MSNFEAMGSWKISGVVESISSTWREVALRERRLFIGLIVVHFLLAGWFITRTDFTADESDYFGYAIRWAKGDASRIYPIDDSKSPIVAPAIIAVLAKPFLNMSNDPYGNQLLQIGRWIMYIFQALGATVLFLWMYRLWGPKYWLPPLVLYLFDPTVFSYSMIVGSDLACASLVLATCYTLWRYTQTSSMRYWLWCCMFCALALVAKASMIYLPALMLLLVVVQRVWSRQNDDQKIGAGIWLRNAAMLAMICWLAICTAYQYQHMFFPFKELPAQSHSMQALKQSLTGFSNWPVPLPYDYVSAFDLLRYHGDLGGIIHPDNTFAGVSIWGHYYERGPVWYYYLAVFIIKLPLVTILLLVTAVFLLFKKGIIAALKHHLFVWVPFLFFGLMLSLTNPFQIGIRHGLMLFPFLYMFAGYGVRFWQQRRPAMLKGVYMVHVVYLVSFWPNMIAYTNELFWPKHMIYQYVHDSTVSYAQSSPYLKKFLASHPEYAKAPTTPKAGKFVVLIEEYAVARNRLGYEWLYKHYKPVGHYMQNVLLFDVSEASLRENGLLPAVAK